MILSSKFLAIVAPLIIFEICFLSTVSGDDTITSLPGQTPVNFKQYAGYITIDDKQDKALFYYFVEAENDPQTKPLVLWLDGGPGCSSVAGAFFGYGPFTPEGDGLVRNNYSWNKEANVLFLDSPTGVGFSYSPKPVANFTSDEITVNTAQDNLAFLFKWFEQYPMYKNRDFFITGISYAGHYVPQLAKLILHARLKSNLKGIAIGSPLLDLTTDFNSQAEFLWSHGLISDSTYAMLHSTCNISQIFRESLEGNVSSACSQVNDQSIGEIGRFVSIDNVLLDVCLSSSPSQTKKDGIDACLITKIINYFNKKDVQEAFHGKLIGVDQWSVCINYESIGYNKKDFFVSTLPLLGELVKAGVRVMVHSGDQDALIPFIGTRTLVDKLAKAMGLNTTVPYSSWLLDEQVGGWTQVYGNILSFATVRGGGHTSSYSQPERTLAILNTFLKGEMLPSSN